MAEAEPSGCCKCMCCSITIAAVIAAFVTFVVIACTSKDAAYTVTITGVAGLDPVLTAANLSSPVFNLTVRIDNARDRLSDACIDRLSTVAVSYGDALLARGSVPRLCAKEGKVRERRARAWGQGVALPPFLRDQLAGELAAGEASVDVKVTTPAANYKDGDTVLVCSEAKIGGGPAPCHKESVYHQQQANPGSTG